MRVPTWNYFDKVLGKSLRELPLRLLVIDASS
jgi:hypothetical protein